MEETPTETIRRVGLPAYERQRTLIAVIEALKQALTDEKIVNAFRTSYLHPFRRKPHYTQEKEDQQLAPEDRERLATFTGDTETAKEKYYSGVLTSEEGMAWLREYEKYPLKVTNPLSRVLLVTPQGRLVVAAQSVEDDELANTAEYALVDVCSETETFDLRKTQLFPVCLSDPWSLNLLINRFCL